MAWKVAGVLFLHPSVRLQRADCQFLLVKSWCSLDDGRISSLSGASSSAGRPISSPQTTSWYYTIEQPIKQKNGSSDKEPTSGRKSLVGSGASIRIDYIILLSLVISAGVAFGPPFSLPIKTRRKRLLFIGDLGGSRTRVVGMKTRCTNRYTTRP